MKVTAKFILVPLGLLVLLTGSEVFGQVVDRGRYYCPIHDEIYSTAGEHGSQCSATRTAPPAEKVELLYCTKCNTKYPKGTRHTCPVQPPVVVSRPNTGSSSVVSETRKYRTNGSRPFVDIDMLFVQQPVRGFVIRDYGGGWGGSTYYNLRRENRLRELLGGDKHHHRDHHEPERHKHSDHHIEMGRIW